MGEYDLEDLNVLVLQQFVTSLLHMDNEKVLVTGTINNIISVVQTSLKQAYTLGYVKQYDVDKICRPRNVEKRIECFSLTEQKRIEDYIKESHKTKPYEIIFCLYTGMRIGELLALEWQHVILNSCCIIIEKTCFYLNNKRYEDVQRLVLLDG